ncbi:DUF1178 family protein [Pseudorhodoferax sp.]|uniref:DUF1178 family protein n=1 Tax=Pseudorhodoferax sp. TaxID=1993553 RepID=UPI002DD6A677|nr:DUF1178 family protein [Pseudorhodoferax sp.]
MKVLDLQCPHGHSFEGWFGSEDDFQSQLARQLVECPVCGDTAVTKKLSAPRLNLGASAPSESPQREVAAVDPQLQAAWMKMVRHVLANTEDVGGKFAEEARRIHYGETAERNIRGQASREETESLLEEGISVMPLPIPKALKGPLQ